MQTSTPKQPIQRARRGTPMEVPYEVKRAFEERDKRRERAGRIRNFKKAKGRV